MTDSHPTGPHQGQPILAAGEPLADARAALVLVHGRGASAESILKLIEYIGQPGYAYLAPQAAGHTWYPHRFTAPVEANEPHLSSALALLNEVITNAVRGGLPRERIVVSGFSQGACLALEYAARHAARLGGVIAFSGGLIGETIAARDPAGALAGTPVFIGCGDADPHIALDRVEASAAWLADHGAAVTKRIYPEMGHTIIDDEIAFTRVLLNEVVTS